MDNDLNRTSILPALPGSVADCKPYLDLSRYQLSLTNNYPEPHYLLNFMDVGFSALGGIQAVTGQKKNGKTWVMTQLMAAILNSESERVKALLPGLELNPATADYLGHEPTVLYIDTEMEKLNTAKVLRRVHWLCDWDMHRDNDRFHSLWLRSIQDSDGIKAWKQRREIIYHAIETYKPTAVFIDGIRDIIGDFNSNEESAQLVSEMMAVATTYDCCIWNVLHMNPRPGNDDESKMRGHLGTELGNKVTDTLASYKKKDGNGSVIFTVKQLDARGKDLSDWHFEITKEAGELGVPSMTNQIPVAEPKAVKADSPEDIKQWLIDGQRDIEWPATGVEIKEMFKQYGKVKRGEKLQADIQVAIAQKFIIPQADEERARGQKYPKYKLNDTIIPPF